MVRLQHHQRGLGEPGVVEGTQHEAHLLVGERHRGQEGAPRLARHRRGHERLVGRLRQKPRHRRARLPRLVGLALGYAGCAELAAAAVGSEAPPAAVLGDGARRLLPLLIRRGEAAGVAVECRRRHVQSAGGAVPSDLGCVLGPRRVGRQQMRVVVAVGANARVPDAPWHRPRAVRQVEAHHHVELLLLLLLLQERRLRLARDEPIDEQLLVSVERAPRAEPRVVGARAVAVGRDVEAVRPLGVTVLLGEAVEAALVLVGLVAVEDLAHPQRRPAVLAEVLRQRRPAVGVGAHRLAEVVGPHVEDARRAGRAAREEAVAARPTQGNLSEGALEARAPRRQPIDGRRVHPRPAVRADLHVEVVEDDVEDVARHGAGGARVTTTVRAQSWPRGPHSFGDGLQSGPEFDSQINTCNNCTCACCCSQIVMQATAAKAAGPAARSVLRERPARQAAGRQCHERACSAGRVVPHEGPALR